METNTENHIKVREARSYARCIKLGLSTAADHAGVVWTHTWPSVLLSLVLPFPGLIIFIGQLDRLLCEWRELGFVPRRKPLEGWRMDAHRSVRALVSLLVFVFIICVIGSCTWAAMVYLPHGKLMAMAAMVILALVALPSVMMMMEVEYSDSPLPVCRAGWLTGFRHSGSLLAYSLLLFMINLLIMLAGTFPMNIVTMASTQAWQAALAGDTVMTPTMWPLAIIASYIIFLIFTFSAITVTAFCNNLFWGSIHAREAEKKQD